MDWLTTSTILRDLRDFGQAEAWHEFVERFRRPIIAFARKLGIPSDDAEDVAQETLVAFAEAYRQGKYDREKGRLSQWLFGIAYNKAVRQRERTAKKEVTAGAAADPRSFLGDIPDHNSATNIWDQQWESALLEECLKRTRQEVEPNTWRAFEMNVLENQPTNDVARTLGIAPTTVYNAKHRIVKRLRELRQFFEDTEK